MILKISNVYLICINRLKFTQNIQWFFVNARNSGSFFLSNRENLETQEDLLEKRYEDKINNIQNSLKTFYTEELKVRTALFAAVLWSASCGLDSPEFFFFF